MARPRKSDEMHRYLGTEIRAPQSKGPLPFVGGRPRMPKHLGKEAKRAFKHAVELLEQRRTITPGDEQILALYAALVSRWCALLAQLGDQFLLNVTVLDSGGHAHQVQRVHPLVKLLSECESRLLQVTSKLGLTLTDRQRSHPTAHDPKEEVIPGSLADTHPELFNSTNVVEFVSPTPISPEDLANEPIDNE